MARGPVVTAAGLPRLRRALRAMGDDLADLRAANGAVVGVVVPAAVVLAPRKTGRTAASVRGSRSANRATVRAGGPGLPYVAPVHWGWQAHHIKAHPWVVEAAELTEPRWTGVYQEHVDKAVAKVGRHY